MATMLCRERKGEINRQICRNLCEPVRCAKVRIALYALSLTATCILSWLTRRPVHENYKEEVLRESLDIRLGSVSYSGTSCYAADASKRAACTLSTIQTACELAPVYAPAGSLWSIINSTGASSHTQRDAQLRHSLGVRLNMRVPIVAERERERRCSSDERLAPVLLVCG